MYIHTLKISAFLMLLFEMACRHVLEHWCPGPREADATPSRTSAHKGRVSPEASEVGPWFILGRTLIGQQKKVGDWPQCWVHLGPPWLRSWEVRLPVSCGIPCHPGRVLPRQGPWRIAQSLGADRRELFIVLTDAIPGCSRKVIT